MDMQTATLAADTAPRAPMQSLPGRQGLPGLRERLVAAVGAAAVIDKAARLDLLGQDVYRAGGVPHLAVRPTSVKALQAAVAACAAAGVAMVPRGGGASYSDGYLHAPGGHVLFDLGGLDSIELDLANAVVTVGPGVTWAALKTRLAAEGLRTPFWGPFSGLVATVGGSISQHTVSHGSAAHGLSAESVLGMDIVLASGELLRTTPSRATRHVGPDLTGLFTGDCGALGIKAAIHLPLIAVRPHFQALSFAFDAFPAFHAALREAALHRLDDEHFAIDLALSEAQTGKQDSLAQKLHIAAAMFKSAPNALAGALQLLRVLRAGTAALSAGAYMGHFIVEGGNAAEAAAKASQLRRLMQRHGREIANTVPGFVRALPFPPLTSALGPRGERWVPLHGVLAHDRVAAFHAALADLRAARQAEMQRLGVWLGSMFMGVGSTGFLYELALYWPDERSAYAASVLDSAYLASLPVHLPNPTARAFIEQLKTELVALFAAHGATHFQLGRSYPYTQRLDPQAHALITAIKAALDPHHLMNPGVLGLHPTATHALSP